MNLQTKQLPWFQQEPKFEQKFFDPANMRLIAPQIHLKKKRNRYNLESNKSQKCSPQISCKKKIGMSQIVELNDSMEIDLPEMVTSCLSSEDSILSKSDTLTEDGINIGRLIMNFQRFQPPLASHL